MSQKVPDITYVAPEDPMVKKVAIRAIERLSGKPRIQRLYENLIEEISDQDEEENFWLAALEQLQVRLDYDAAKIASVPKEGPLVFVANHPYGVLDGLAICYLASQTRSVYKILINNVLCQEERVASHSLPIDFNDTKEAVLLNINSKKEAMEILRNDGAVVIFPGGGVSTSKGPFGQVTDLEWKLFAAKLIHMSKATVVPMYFHGHNSRIFQIASHFSLTLRLSLLLHEVRNKIGKTITITVGDPIPYEHIANIKGRKELTNYLREITFALGDNFDPSHLEPPDIRFGY